MSTEENKAVVRREIEELFNKGNLDAADEIYAPNYVGHEPSFGDVRGVEGAEQFAAGKVEDWTNFDALGMMQKLGLIPEQ